MADIAYITQDSGSIDQSLELARIAIEKFYTSGPSSERASSLQEAQNASLAARSAENSALDLQAKTVPELIELLTHRDHHLKQRACALLKLKAVDSKVAEDVRVRDQVKEHLTLPLSLQILFSCTIIDSMPQLQFDSLSILIGLLTDEIKDRIRQVGCLDTLASLWKKTLPENVLSRVLFLSMELTTNEHNSLALKHTKRIPELAGFLNPETKLSLQNQPFLLALLRNLSKVPKNRDTITKSGVVPHLIQLALKLWKVPISANQVVPPKDAQQAQIILECLANLALGASMKTNITAIELKQLISILDGKKTIKKDWMISPQPDQEYFIMTMIQGQLLELLANLSTFDKNRRTMGEELLLVQQLLIFFLPGDGSCISADAMYFWMDLMDNLVQHEENRAVFVKYRGIDLMLQCLREPKNTEYQQHRALNHRTIDLIITCITNGGVVNNQSQVSTVAASQSVYDDQTLNQVFQILMNYYNQCSDDTTILLNVLKMMNHVAIIENHRQGLALIPGFIDFVIKSVLTCNVASAIEDGTNILINMANSVGHVKAQLNKQAVTLVPALLAYIGNDRLQIQIKIATLIAQVFADDPIGTPVVVHRGATTVVAGLLQSTTSTQLQEQALAILDNLLSHFPEIDQLRHQYLAGGILPLMFNLLSSGDERVQVRAFSLLSRVVDHRPCKIALDSLGIVNKLEELSKHPNVVKEKSMVASLMNMVKPKLTGSVANLKDAIALAEENPEAAADVLLSKLTKWQLMQLLKHALNQCPDLMPLINDTIQANIVNPPVKKKKAEVAPSSGVETTSIMTGLKPIAYAPATAKPSSSAPKKPTSSPVSVFDELTSKAKGGMLKLKHVDPEKEKEKKAMQARSSTPLSSIFQGIKEQAPNGLGSVKLLEQTTVEGRKYWLKDMTRYIEEVEKSFSFDYHFMKVLLHLLESTTPMVSFDQLIAFSAKKDQPMEPSRLAELLRQLGFTIKQNVVLLPNSETPTTEYKYVITPSDLPMQQICKTIVVAVAKSTPSFTNSLPSDARDKLQPILAKDTQSSIPSQKSQPSMTTQQVQPAQVEETFTCRLCSSDFPKSQAIDVRGRNFCSSCSERVLAALKEREP